jgi:hypothetical protein
VFPDLPVPSKTMVLSVLSNLLGLLGLVLAPLAVGGITRNGYWTMAVAAAELGALSYLVGLAAQQAKAKAGPRPAAERRAA